MATTSRPVAPGATLVPGSSDTTPYLVFLPLTADTALVHGVFTRAGGVSVGPYASLNVSLAVGDERDRVAENRRRLARALDFPPHHVYGGRQVHGARWRAVDTTLAPADLERQPCDILVSGAPGRLLVLKFADCTPLILWDRRRCWVAVAHAGWRGTVLGVARIAVRALAEAGACAPADLWAAVGPAIGPCCYEVGPEVVKAVAATTSDPTAVVFPGAGDRAYVDLAEANRQQLEAAGVPPDRILRAPDCTACKPAIFFSHRAIGWPAGRFAVAAGVRP